MRIGDANRAVGTTGMNDVSSRSHSVVQITLEVRDTVARSLQVSKLSLVDLAGSESVSRTGAEGLVLDEARTINKSLFNLAKVINSLAAMAEDGAAAAAAAAAAAGGAAAGGAGASVAAAAAAEAAAAAAAKAKTQHIPYRDSKCVAYVCAAAGRVYFQLLARSIAVWQSTRDTTFPAASAAA